MSRLYNYSQDSLDKLKARYGITQDEFEDLLDEQNFSCIICGDTIRFNPVVDHCHTCSEVRGLLCGRCNRGLGMLRDDPSLLARALVYLERCHCHQSKQPREPGKLLRKRLLRGR